MLIAIRASQRHRISSSRTTCDSTSTGKIRELTVFFRPMPAIAVAARALGEGLGRRKSNARARLISLLVSPLILLTRVGDRIATRLVRPTL